MTLLEPDRGQIERFVTYLLRHAGTEGWVSIRSFSDNSKPFRIQAVPLTAGLNYLISVAEDIARRAANEPKKTVFTPPLGVFSNPDNAREDDLLAGLCLSVDCDQHPDEARETLEGILGPATVVVRSGGKWTDETGQAHDKLHLHWRLSKPARDGALPELKRARELAARIVGGDMSNVPIVHPIRWPGGWHRKGEPVLCTIAAEDTDAEIDLAAALKVLEAAAPAQPRTNGKGAASGKVYEHNGLGLETGKVIDGREWHMTEIVLAKFIDYCGQFRVAPSAEELCEHAWDAYEQSTSFDRPGRGKDEFLKKCRSTVRRFLNGHIKGLETLEQAVEAYDLNRAAREAADAPSVVPSQVADAPPRPVDLWGVFTPPVLPTGSLPKVIEDFARVQATIMGADPAGLAVSALVVAGAAIKDSISLQVKEHSQGWTEEARIWGGLIGDPSTKKTPIIREAERPLRKIDLELWRQYVDAMARYNALDKDDKKGTEPAPQVRVRLEDTTIEAAQEVLKDSPGGVLLSQDELSGFFGSMDKYNSHRGAAKDRGFWLQAWNGGPYAFNRIGRGPGLVPNLSVSLLGGIQPDLIRKLAADAHDDGMLQRMFPIVLRPAVLGSDEPIPAEADDYARVIDRLYQLTPASIGFWGTSGSQTRLVFDAGAQAIRQDLERKNLDLAKLETVNKKLAAHIGKYDGLFARLCVIWHCVENCFNDKVPRLIPAKTAQRVADFLHKFLLPHAVAFYGNILGLADDHDRLAAVAGYILARRLERVTNRDVARGDRTMRRLTKRETEEVFEQLEALGWLTGHKPGKRPSDPPHWVVNPECHQLFAKRAEAEAARRSEARDLIKEFVNAIP